MEDKVPIGIALTNIALKAARDHKSRKPSKRLKAAMNAILDFDPKVDEETALMSAVGATIRVVDDRTAEEIQRELYGLGRLSSLIQGTPEGETPDEEEMARIEKDMPSMSARLGILLLWERCRAEHGLLRELGLPQDQDPKQEIGEDPEDWKK